MLILDRDLCALHSPETHTVAVLPFGTTDNSPYDALLFV